MPQDSHALQTHGGSEPFRSPIPEHAIAELKSLIEEGRLDEAERAIALALEAHGRDPTLLERMARLAELRERWPEALALWRELAEKVPAWHLPIISQAETLRVMGDLVAAEAVLDHLAPADADHAQVLACRARLVAAQRDWDRAIEIWRLLKAREGYTLLANLGVIDALIEQQRLTEAVDELLLFSPYLAGHPNVSERHARVLATRGDWDGCFDVLRPLLFQDSPSHWAMHQAVWVLVELRRFGVLRGLRSDLSASGRHNPVLEAKLDDALRQGAAFDVATRIALERLTASGLSVRDMVATVAREFRTEDRLRDAAEWLLYSRYPNDLDVLLMMANPLPLVPLSMHRSYYFRRLVMLRYPASQAALRQHIYNLFSAKQYDDVLSSVEAHGLTRVSDAVVMQIYMMAQDIGGAREGDGRNGMVPHMQLPSGFLDLLTERYRNARLLPVKSVQRRVFGAAERPRIALCISGQLRGYPQCFASLRRHVMERYDTKVFVHTWSKVGNAQGSHGARLHRMLPDEVAAEIPRQWSDEDFFARYPTALDVLHAEVTVSREELSRFMHPAECFIEDEAAFEAASAHLEMADDRDIMNQYKLFFQMSKCLEKAGLADPGRWNEYDLVMWTRPDMKIPRMHIAPLLRDCIDDGFIVTSSLPPLGVGDFTLIGTPANMSVLTSLWPRLKSRGFRDDRYAIQGFGPALLCNHLFRHGRKVKHTDMFVAPDSGPHGARPDSMKLLLAMLRDLAGSPEWLPFEAKALGQLVRVCLAESTAESHRTAVMNAVRSGTRASPHMRRNLLPQFPWL